MADDKKKQESLEQNSDNLQKTDESSENQPEGSGLFTADGKELPKIDGGYTLYEPESNFGDNDFTSV